MKKDRLIAYSIPFIFIASIIAFFALIPAESWTPVNLVGYVSSLSTAIMVLVYVFTTSRQLTVMHHQLEEMQFTRNLQTQPLPIATFLKGEIEAPTFYTGPEEKFSKLYSAYRVFMEGQIENIGNGSAVSIVILHKIVCQESDKLASEFEKLCPVAYEISEEFETIKGSTEPVAFLSLKEGHLEKISCLVSDVKQKFTKCILSPKMTNTYLDLTILYKNVLGANFEAKMVYWIDYDEADFDKIKSIMKAIENSKIDFATETEEYRSLWNRKEYEKAYELADKLGEEFEKKYGCENIPLKLELIPNSFSVSPITEETYRKEISKNRALP